MATVTAATADISAVRAQRYQICLVHPFDPRGQKVGGLETYLRDFITFHPADTDLLFVGVDSVGDLELGKVHRLTFRGRQFDFMPILRYSGRRCARGGDDDPQIPDRPVLYRAVAAFLARGR